MGEMIGRLVVSGDYRGNLRKLAKELNKFATHSDDGEFIVQGKQILFSKMRTSSPSVDFGRWFFEFSDGRKVYTDEMTRSQVYRAHCSDDVVDEGDEDAPLELISARIAPHLTQGKLTITAIAFETQLEDGYFGSLTVDCDGKIDRVYHAVDDVQGFICKRESYRATSAQ